MAKKKKVARAKSLSGKASPDKSRSRGPARRTRSKSRRVSGSKDRVPIIAIGASAGGLDAIGRFLRNIEKDVRAAYVVIQHLDPSQEGILPELLQRSTELTVNRAQDGMIVVPNAVYVIPANRDMSILRNTLHLFEPTAPQGLRLPIDFFLRSLAQDRERDSIGVVLSGMGTDGLLGARSIKAEGGLMFVQRPATAAFDSMPRHVIDAGLADIVAPPEELPAKIAALLRDGDAKADPSEDASIRDALEKIAILLRARTKHDFSLYKKNTFYRRVERRIAIHQLPGIDAYVRFLRENVHELDLLFNELLIGVTGFFRDPPAWKVLQERALTELITANPSGKALRAWVAGCSTGEEAYSLAIAFRESMEQVQPRFQSTLHVFATDVQNDSVSKARGAFFPPNIAADVAPERLSRFFLEDGGRYRITREIREMVTFAKQDVIADPPFTKLDIVVCRNLLIYLEPELQKRLIPLFHYSLNPGGILFLGSAETVGGFGDLFSPIDASMRIYRRRDVAVTTRSIQLQQHRGGAGSDARRAAAAARPVASLQTAIDQLLLERVSPAAVLVNAQGDIVYTRGRTGRFLEPASGKANWNIFAMARKGLRGELVAAIQKAQRTKSEAHATQIKMDRKDGRGVDVTVHHLSEPQQLRGMLLVLISESTASKARTTRSQATKATVLQAALDQAHEDLRVLHEDMQSSREELESANEELQSINEELTTSKEEMQSMNEELQMVNQELQAKVDELSWASDDMKNLLNGTNIATIFLNNHLNIRRFTTQATQIFKLIPGDVGRPLSDIVTTLKYPELQQDAQEVLRTLIFCERQVTTADRRWFGARIMPYRTMENTIDGVVITFVDITSAKHLESELRLRLDSLGPSTDVR